MSDFDRKWGIMLNALLFVLPLLGLKAAFHYLEWERISAGSIVGTFLGGVFFVIAIILSGVMVDFKESEKIISDLAASLDTLYHDSMLAGRKASPESIQGHIKGLIHVLLDNFKRQGTWSIREVNSAIDKVDEDIRYFVEQDVQFGLVTKLRTELTNVKKISNRVEVIKETSFLPAGHAIAQFGVLCAMAILLMLKIEPLYEALALTGVVTMILTSVVLLIRDMDNPFEGRANIDMRQLYKLEKYLDTAKKEETAGGL